MKKTTKSLVLLGITTSVIAASGIIQNIKPLKLELEEKKILGYNHNPASALDNVFIEDGMTILPFIYENPDETMTEARIREEFRKAGLTIKNISSPRADRKFGTGTEITVEENAHVYTVLVYGDINADGLVDIDDAVDLIEAVKFQETKGLSGIYYKAGNVDDEPKALDISDAVEIITFVRGLNKIPVIEPESLKEKDSITSIEMATQPGKTKYNYGETSIDLTGATIKIHWQSGNTTTTSIVPGMLGEYNLNTEGPHDITVSYEGHNTSFQITVLNKISALQITGDGRSEDVTEELGGYKVDSNADFAIGTIKAANEDTVSALKPDMLTITIPDEYKDNLTIYDIVENNGVIKGKATKAGTYKIVASITYGEQAPIELPITIQAVKSEKVGNIEFSMEKDDLRVGQPLRIGIDITNIYGEEITPKSITINDISGIKITKLDKNGGIVTDANSSQIKFIEISTTLENATTLNFTIKAIGKPANNEITRDITLQIKDMLYVNSITGADSAPLYLEANANTKYDDNRNIYTVLPVNFVDQEGNEIKLTKNSIKIITTELQLNNLTLKKGEVAIVVPDVKLKIGNTEFDSQGILTEVYDENESVNGIGIAINTHMSGMEVVLSSINKKEIRIIGHTKQNIATIPLQVVYKELQNMDIKPNEALTVNSEGFYVAQLNQEFTLGTIEVGENEGPLTVDMLQGIDNEELKVSYVEEAGKITVKCTIKKAGKYNIKPTTGTISTSSSLSVMAEGIPEITDINLTGLNNDKLNVEIGTPTKSNLTVKTTENPTGEEIKARDIQVNVGENEKDKVKVSLLGTDGVAIANPEDTPAILVGGIQIEAATGVTEDFSTNITITVFSNKEGIENNTITKTVDVYNPIPRYFELENENGDSTAVLSTTEETLYKISAWADENHTRPVTLKYDMIQINKTNQKQNTIDIKTPEFTMVSETDATSTKTKKITARIMNTEKVTMNLSNRNGVVGYISLKAELTSGYSIANPAELNGLTITFRAIATDGEEKTITTSYTAP